MCIRLNFECIDITMKQNCVNLLKNSIERNIQLSMHFVKVVLLVDKKYFQLKETVHGNFSSG